MQQVPSRLNDYGDLILELDKLIRTDRSSLINSSANPCTPYRGQVDCYTQVSSRPETRCNLHNPRPSPTLWETCPPFQQHDPIGIHDSPNARGGQDLRQVRLFKTRFCSYGMECPYLAKGKCLYAHSKEEIRCRPPPPSIANKLSAQRSVNGSLSPSKLLLDSSPIRAGDCVWSVPVASDFSGAPNSSYLLDYLNESDQPNNLHYSQSKSTVASSSKSSLFGSVSFSDTLY